MCLSFGRRCYDCALRRRRHRPDSQTWTIAPGTLRGTVYYNSYTSLLAVGGGTLKIKIGQQAQLLLGGCQVCHAVSANGSVLSVSQFDYHSGLTYDLKGNMKSMASNSGAEFNFGALTPNGAKLMSCGAPSMLLSSVVGNWTPQNGCEGGDECCSGFCRVGEDGGFRCVEPPNACSEEFERCTTDADCCVPRFYYEPRMTCINSRCAKVSGPN